MIDFEFGNGLHGAIAEALDAAGVDDHVPGPAPPRDDEADARDGG